VASPNVVSSSPILSGIVIRLGDLGDLGLVEKLLYDFGRFQDASSCNSRINVLQEVVNMSHEQAKKIVNGALSQQHTKAEDYPRQIGGREREQPEETQLHISIVSAPYVNDHERQGRSEEQKLSLVQQKVHAELEQQQHDGPEQPQEEKIPCAPPKKSLFQTSTVLNSEKTCETRS